jgi:hypothetical protein
LTRHRFSLLIGRVSINKTLSPIRHSILLVGPSPFSSSGYTFVGRVKDEPVDHHTHGFVHLVAEYHTHYQSCVFLSPIGLLSFTQLEFPAVAAGMIIVLQRAPLEIISKRGLHEG